MNNKKLQNFIVNFQREYVIIFCRELIRVSVEKIKALGKNRSKESFDTLISLYYCDLPVEEKREIVSSIGRQNDTDSIYDFLAENAFKKNNMDVIYQMFRTTLVYYKKDNRFKKLCEKMKAYYDNEIMNKMYEYKLAPKFDNKRLNESSIKKPLLLEGDSAKTLKYIKDGDINLVFTSPPYYNAREYSEYINYKSYLNTLEKVFVECHRVLQDGRFIIIDVSPVITKRPGREYESIRYPIHYDLHNILVSVGFYFVDEIIWEKPEPSVPNRIGGYAQTKNPLSYKPNCVTESIMVYRKNCNFLLDKNISMYTSKKDYIPNDNYIDRSNVWKIAPSSNKLHPAVFPDELCKKVLKYYSFKGDTVLDPFAGIGTFGRVAYAMQRIPVMCEINQKYLKVMAEEQIYYDISKTSNR